MKAIVTLVSLTFCIFCSAQNIVLNPGLESYITCPGFGQFSNSYIADWDKPSYGSTDYYHYSCPGIVPTQQVPRSGSAYAGIIGYNYGAEYREYMTGMLSNPLNPGATYFCEFYVSLNDGYIQAIKELGAYFSPAIPGPYTNALHIPVTPQVQNTVNLLDDTAGWMRVSGYFLASGGEQYITIGNFNTDSNTTIVQVGSVGSYGSYYFVDDVWVSLSEGLGMADGTGWEVGIFPNPVKSTMTIRSSLSGIISFEIFNTLGQKVFSAGKSVHGMQKNFDISILPSGIYAAEIRCGEMTQRKLFTKE
jgi:OmpA-OmpF porin, OOP family